MSAENTSEYFGQNEGLLEQIGVQAASPEERDAILGDLQKHFTEIVWKTAQNELSDEQLQQITVTAQEQPDQVLDLITTMCADIPGLSAKIQDAISTEIEILKAALAATRSK